ncbi:serine/threonine protein kinase [Cellulomonas marina]|uniref:non-specific serine/threonine protein kinase n=2 Tax=Cellulomonas marina TaxID=988821 RepID=A0A1I0W1J3_9CELL|nr:Stk1 family PASTA domain-containing Ser/Thr kinase [Cellulomonas marina]GIG27412.1 serine/threonine protein kinase [Cellulomonas marina]SFA82288.1 serine/threonine protein kinase [Cellulomonas marina]
MIGRLVDGRYAVVARIARGGMATVYLGVDRRLDREVAVKVMHPHLAEGASGSEFVARFRREARTAARLTHPGLVAVYDQGLDGDTSYLTMEYVDGSNLRRRLGELGALTPGEALGVAEDVLDALATAHRQGLVHRDIKPENVLLAADGRVKLADFGLARAVTEVTSTSTGTMLGTVAYLAPELVAHGASDARTDVYACGILLYEMLTGRQPFTGETPLMVALQHVKERVPAPSALVPWLPVELDELVAALTAPDADERPEHAGAALALLRRTRGALDAAVLSRRPDVPPSLPAPGAGSGGGDGTGEGWDDDPRADDDGATTRLASGPGTTVALPIGAAAFDDDEVPPPHGRRRRRGALLAVLAVLLLLGGGGVAAWWFAAGPGARVAVPALVGREEAAAVALLQDAGLRGERGETFSDEPVGSVVASDPAPGTSVPLDAVVGYTVSLGPDLVDVPTEGVVGALQADAAAVLAAADLQVAYEQAYDDAAGPGFVLGAARPDGAPLEGGQLERGSVVTLTVSQGPAPVTIISVVGQTLDAARAALSQDALEVVVEEAFSDTVDAGRVVSQDPASGTAGHRRDTVTVVVSKGPELVEVPDLTGRQYDDAAAALEALGLRADRTNVLGGIFGTVRSQSVDPGDQVRKGTTVTLTVV